MTTEFSHDEPVNHEAFVATYTPEMVAARDALIARLQAMKEPAKAADVTNTLHPRLGVYTYDNGATILEFGHRPEIFEEAAAQYDIDKTVKDAALDFDGVGLPGSDMLIVTYDLDKLPASEDLPVATIEQPMLKLEWGGLDGDETVENRLAVYRDGYVETSAEVTRVDYVHPPDASDFVRANAQPKIAQETTVVPGIPQPAELADIQNAAAQLDGTIARYNIGL